MQRSYTLQKAVWRIGPAGLPLPRTDAVDTFCKLTGHARQPLDQWGGTSLPDASLEGSWLSVLV